MQHHHLRPLGLGLGLVVCSFGAACGNPRDATFDPKASGGSGGSGGGLGLTTAGGGHSTGSGGTFTITTGADYDAGTPQGPCTGLACQQTTCTLGDCKQRPCAAGAKTTVSGTVLDPAGKVPLYNVIVYVPNAPLDPMVEGATCDKCGSISGSPIAATLTDTKGNFVLSNVPVGTDIPLVIQIGKWRRQLKVPAIAACADTPIADKTLTRLPKNKSEGDIPKMALTTGGWDPLECLLRKIGIDDSEFTPETGTGRVNYYAGVGGTSSFAPANGGANFSPVVPFWNDLAMLKKYDVVLMACDGQESPQDKSAMARKSIQDYAGIGGRLFMSHWNNFWLENGPEPFPTAAAWNHQPDLANPFTAQIDTTFPKGAALADWLVNVQGSTTRGQLVIREAQHTIDAVNPGAQRWIYGENPKSIQYLTLNTPMGAKPEDQCGRIVLSDIHVSSGDRINAPFPSGCTTTDLSPQEKALEFMLFDLTSCVRDDMAPPIPPVIN
ncbi:MAG TPA: carboxypeptidase-like regulatory domain-containing protein [Polyangiaceae bacterium]|nr:carboxypeptidase-like regulatory domain-containing protein [Polyangiaceae bacterium]